MHTETTKRQFSHLVARLQATMLETGTCPETLVGSALTQWCKSQYAGLPPHGLKTSGALYTSEHVTALVAFLMGCEDLIEASYWLASLYTKMVAPNDRKRLSMYFTPPSLTRRLLEDLEDVGVDFSEKRFCDPACGGAAFLMPIALRIRTSLIKKGLGPRSILEHIQEHLLGFDLEPTLCELSKHFLLMALVEDVNACGGWVPQLQVRVANSLNEATQLIGSLDVVVCNPPYRKMRAQEVAQYRDAYAKAIQAQPNLYGLFIALCIELLTPDGICALVTPTSFMSGQYFQRLRQLMLSSSDVLKIGMVSDRLGVFIDVQQETALTLARKRRTTRSANHVVNTAVSVVSSDGNYLSVGQCNLPEKGDCWPIPRTETDAELLNRASRLTATLQDYGYRTRIGAFVWNRDTRQTYASMTAANKQLSDARNKLVPLLWSSDIRGDGRLLFDGKPKANGEDCLVNPGSKSHSSVVTQAAVLLQRVTSNDQARRLISAPVPHWIYEKYGGFIGENHTVVLEQIVRQPALSTQELSQMLSSSLIDRCYRCISGTTNVSAFELSQLRLPHPQALRQLLDKGLTMEETIEQLLLK